MNTNTNNIDEMITTSIRPVFDATNKLDLAMNIGDRTPVKEMAAAVGMMLNIEPSTILPFVHYFCHNSNTGYVSQGRTGGYIHNGTGKPQRLPTQSSSDTDTTLEDTTEDPQE
jgi:hypothetical protein